jgi:hypothetical protein
MTHENVLRDLCKGNWDAFGFCKAFLAWAHALDDVVDKASEDALTRFVLSNRTMLGEAAMNCFFQENAPSLLPLLTNACVAYVDSNRLAQSPNLKERVSAEILKSYYHEVFWHVAYLVGGLKHMQAMTAAYRDFDFG